MTRPAAGAGERNTNTPGQAGNGAGSNPGDLTIEAIIAKAVEQARLLATPGPTAIAKTIRHLVAAHTTATGLRAQAHPDPAKDALTDITAGIEKALRLLGHEPDGGTA